MKKLSRALAVLLAAMLLLSCSLAVAEDYAAPKKVSAIEGLPDMPDVPTMKTKNNGVTETITLSDELESLSAYWNWVEFPIELDGTTATYDIAENNKKFKCQQGMYTWDKTWDEFFWVDGMFDGFSAFYEYEDTDPDEIDQWYDDALAWALLDDPQIKAGSEKDPHHIYHHSAEYLSFEFYPATEFELDIYGDDFVGTHEVYWMCDTWIEGFGVYEMAAYQGYGNNQDGHGFAGAEFAFDGWTKDGVNVKYNRHGDNTARSVIVDDANVFGTETAPDKTEFVWIRFQRADGSIAYHLHTIIATYEEGDYDTIQAWYSAGGDLRQVHAVPTQRPADLSETEDEAAEEPAAEEPAVEEPADKKGADFIISASIDNITFTVDD